MKSQEDIGSLIKTKLQATERVSNEATWDRIQHSLEARKKKRRFAFYMKLGSASLLVLTGIFFIINYTTENSKNANPLHKEIKLNTTDNLEKINSRKEENLQTISNIQNDVILKNGLKEEVKTIKSKHQEQVAGTESLSKKSEVLQTSSNTKSNATLENDTTKITKQHHQEKENVTQVSSKKEKPSNSENKSTTHKAKDISEVISVNNKENTSTNASEKSPVHTTITDTIVNRNDVPVTQTTQKIYYYYNSKNGQEISSTNKHVIDSIIKANQVQQDSLKPKN